MATDQLVENLLALWRLLRINTHPVRRGEITPEQYWLLKLLNKRVELSIGELAEVLGVTGSSVTTACKRLEKSGLLKRTRQADGQDERVVLVTLTDQGREQIEAWQQERRNELSKMLAPLSAEEQAELQRLLERILER
ncbi:MAG TPA: MarR family transcriptional regulator [Ktedonobacteraceae bacterium]|nr:MarR family transcriptional regulator [Ktedonobacteraceae bacterium]